MHKLQSVLVEAVMRRKLAVAVLSISSLAIPQFASAGQRPEYYSEYSQNSYYNGGHEWRHGGDNRDGHYGGAYDNHYYYGHDNHAGRSVAIIGGTAAAGAAIGAAAGHGQGAAIGALIGGVAGVVADQAVRHHDHDRRW